MDDRYTVNFGGYLRPSQIFARLGERDQGTTTTHPELRCVARALGD